MDVDGDSDGDGENDADLEGETHDCRGVRLYWGVIFLMMQMDRSVEQSTSPPCYSTATTYLPCRRCEQYGLAENDGRRSPLIHTADVSRCRTESYKNRKLTHVWNCRDGHRLPDTNTISLCDKCTAANVHHSIGDLLDDNLFKPRRLVMKTVFPPQPPIEPIVARLCRFVSRPVHL